MTRRRSLVDTVLLSSGPLASEAAASGTVATAIQLQREA